METAAPSDALTASGLCGVERAARGSAKSAAQLVREGEGRDDDKKTGPLHDYEIPLALRAGTLQWRSSRSTGTAIGGGPH